MYFSTAKAILLLAATPIVRAKVQFLLPINNDGIQQVQHFVKDDGVNLLRLPISWQFLVNNKLGGDLDSGNLAKYDQLMQACLNTGAHCMIDIHNFARWNGGIIGQGGPSDDDFVSLWRQLAIKYASEERIVFELMNEPHDLDLDTWVRTCQKVVTAIREAGATAQMILLPGTNFDSAATLPGIGGAEALLGVTNPDGSTDNLLLDVHKYLDIDNSGTHVQCTTDNTDAFATLAQFLRERGRKGLVSETGASREVSCLTAFCSQNTLINENSDVFVGLVGWGAGSFDTSYILSLTPSKQNNRLVNNQLMTQCLLETWTNSNSSPNSTTTRQLEPSSTFSSRTSPSPASPTSTPESSTPVTNSPKVSATLDADANSNTRTEEYTITLAGTSILRTAAVPTDLTTLLLATDTPGAQSYSIALAQPTSSTSQLPAATSNPAEAAAASAGVTGIWVWGCALLLLLLL
ncbi:hypothetical protein AAE478_003962 [Parahypoxylon ruwenzoriense]